MQTAVTVFERKWPREPPAFERVCKTMAVFGLCISGLFAIVWPRTGGIDPPPDQELAQQQVDHVASLIDYEQCVALDTFRNAGYLDPWGNEVRILCRNNVALVVSAGPDGTLWTDDDIGNARTTYVGPESTGSIQNPYRQEHE